FALGFSPDQVVKVVRLIEVNRAAVRAEMNLSAPASTKRRADRGADKKRQKWRRQKANQRSRLKLVHPSSAALDLRIDCRNDNPPDDDASQPTSSGCSRQ